MVFVFVFVCFDGAKIQPRNCALRIFGELFSWKMKIFFPTVTALHHYSSIWGIFLPKKLLIFIYIYINIKFGFDILGSTFSTVMV